MAPPSAPPAEPERSPSPVSIGPVPFASTAHFEQVLAHIKANVDEEVTRVLQEEAIDDDPALRREIEALVYERFWPGLLEIVHKNVSINGLSHEEAYSSTGIEPYDEDLNRRIFVFQDQVADAVVKNTAERKAFPQRRLHEVKAELAAARPAQPDLSSLPEPTVVDGELPDREHTLRDFKDALGSAQHAQQSIPEQLQRMQRVIAVEDALQRVQARTAA